MNEVFDKSLFGREFDSFEIDDGFLSKVDAAVKNTEKNHLDIVSNYLNDQGINATKKQSTNKNNVCNTPISLKSLNDSDFFEFNSKVNEPAVKTTFQNEALKKSFANCISPIHGPLIPKIGHNHSFSSTPVKKPESCTEPNTKEEKKCQVFENDLFDADLFEDWDNNDFNSSPKLNENNKDDLISLSQAIQLIEEESAKVLNEEKEDLDLSINLLTGEVCNGYENSNKPNVNQELLGDKQKEKTKDCVKMNKPLVAHKLNFFEENVPKKHSAELQSICFSSDEDEIFSKVCLTPKLHNKSLKVKKNNSVINISSDESFNLGKVKKKNVLVIDSDSPEYSPSPKFNRFNKKLTRRKNSQGKKYILSEAEVSGESEVSSDEVDEDSQEYEKSFVDENSYCTQNTSANMTTKYLESVNNVGGKFKIPKTIKHNSINVFSQVPEETNTDYEIDSFCVAEVDDEPKTDLSDLEIAEKVLEMDRKKRKKKQILRRPRKKY